MKTIIKAIAFYAAMLTYAVAANSPGSVIAPQPVPNFAAITGANGHFGPAYPKLQVYGALTAGDGGDGTFTYSSTPCTSDGGGTCLRDADGNSYTRDNISSDLRHFGIVANSAYDISANPTTALDAGTVITTAYTNLGLHGITNLHLNEVNIRIATSPTFPSQSTLSCDIPAGTQSSDGDYTGLKGTIALTHTTTLTYATTLSHVENCLIVPEMLFNPGVVSSFSGYSFSYPPTTHADLEAIRGNMILAGDTAVYFNNSDSGKPQNLHIVGFDNCLHFRKASLTNMHGLWCDGNVGMYSESGGGQSDYDNTTIDSFVTKQANTTGATCDGTGFDSHPGVCSEEFWDITSIAASTTVNAFGQHVCRLTLGLASLNGNSTVNWPGTHLHTSALFANGDPITYPAWTANFPNGGLGCRGTGPHPITVISSDATTAVVDLNDSSYGTGADAVPAVATYDTGSNFLRIVSGDITNIQIGMTVAGTGIPGATTVTNVITSYNGKDPYSGYIAAVIISANTTAPSSGNQNLTFDGGTFAHVATCNGGAVGGCLFLNASDRSFAGTSTAGQAVAQISLSNHHHWAAGIVADGTPGLRSVNAFSFEHHYNFVLQDANNAVFVMQHSDGNGELDDRSLRGQVCLGSGNRCSVLGNGLGKNGTPLTTDLYSLTQSGSDQTTLADAISSTDNGVTIHLASSVAAWGTDQGAGVAPGKLTVSICPTLNSDGVCGSGANTETSFAEYVDSTHLKLNYRGAFNFNPSTFSVGAHVISTRSAAGSGSALYTGMGATATDTGLNILEAQHGATQLTNIFANGNSRNLFISHNSGPNVFFGVDANDGTLMYEDATAQATMVGCGNQFTSVQSWECTRGSSVGAGLNFNTSTNLLEAVGGRSKRVSISTDTVATDNDCNTFYTNGANDKLTLPASPPAGCTFTFSSSLFKLYVIFTGTGLALPGWANDPITTLVICCSGIQDSFFQITWDGTKWQPTSYSRTLYDVITPRDASVIAHGQVYVSHNSGSSRFELVPQNGPGGIITNGHLMRVADAGIYLPDAGTTSSALNYLYAYSNTDSDGVVTGAADNGSGLIRLTITHSETTGAQVTMACFSIGGSYQANGYWSGTVIDSTHIDLLASSSTNLGTYTSGGQCRLLSLKASTTVPVIIGNGVQSMTGDAHYTLVGYSNVAGAHSVTNTFSTYNGTASHNGLALSCSDLVFGAGAGTAPTCTSLTGDDQKFRLLFSTGTAPSASSTVFTITFKTAWTTAPICTMAFETALSIAKSAAVFPTPTTTTLVLTSTVANLAVSTAYDFAFQCVS